jgi:colicin import membrane protein
MGPFTAEMSRLCQEIVTLRQQRQAYIRDLAQNVTGMKAEFRQAHAEMAQKERKFRAASLAELKATVTGMRRAFALDIKGAHRVWFGPSPAERRAEAEAAQQAREKAERLRKEEELRAREAEAEAQQQAEAQARKDEQTQAIAKEKEAGKRAAAKVGAGSERRGAGKKDA